jgi:hypothetical protein
MDTRRCIDCNHGIGKLKDSPDLLLRSSPCGRAGSSSG